MKRLLQILFSFLLLSFLLTPQVKAADINVDCPDSSEACSKTGVADPLFSIAADGYWYPGRTLTKTINLKNSSLQTREMAIRGTETPGVGFLKNVMNISIVGGTTVIWSGSVDAFYSQDNIGMGIFAPDADLDYDFTVSMSSGADDDYQGKETAFDLTLGFWGEPAPTSTPTTTPVSTPTSSPGTVLGTGVSASVCSDDKPGTPTGLTATATGPGSVLLNWVVPSSSYTYFLVAYSDNNIAPKWGNPNIGTATSHTVGGLGTGTYYFWVRAGNGCRPGEFTDPIALTLGTGALGAVPGEPVPGFEEGVLGEATPSAEIEDQTGINGEQTGEIYGEEEEICVNAWWWWIVMVVYGMHSMIIVLVRSSMKRIIKLIFHTVMTLLATALLIFALCSWWLAVLITLIIGIGCYNSIWQTRNTDTD